MAPRPSLFRKRNRYLLFCPRTSSESSDISQIIEAGGLHVFNDYATHLTEALTTSRRAKTYRIKERTKQDGGSPVTLVVNATDSPFTRVSQRPLFSVSVNIAVCTIWGSRRWVYIPMLLELKGSISPFSPKASSFRPAGLNVATGCSDDFPH